MGLSKLSMPRHKSVEKEQLFAQYVALHPKGHSPNQNISTDNLKKQIAHLAKGGMPGKKLACLKRPANASQVALKQPANASQKAPSNSNDMLSEGKRRRCNVKQSDPLLHHLDDKAKDIHCQFIVSCSLARES